MKIDITGHTYGRLFVVKEVERPFHVKANNHRFFECLCECGNKTISTMNGLRRGTSSSCGCYNK